MNILLIVFQILVLVLTPQNHNIISTEIKVYLQVGTSQNDINSIANEIGQINHVVSVKFVSNEEALDLLREKLGDDGRSALEGYNDENNPLPDSFTVGTESPEYNDQVTEEIKQINEMYETEPILSVRS